jgi:hypothetical protein
MLRKMSISEIGGVSRREGEGRRGGVAWYTSEVQLPFSLKAKASFWRYPLGASSNVTERNGHESE